MKIIGISGRSTATRFWSSSPLRPGRETSNTRQLGTRAGVRVRNSRADTNVSGCQPAVRISNSRDSRTEMSSSTTKTIASGCPERDMQRLLESAFAERFEQTLHSGREDSLPRFPVSRNEDDWDVLAALPQLQLQIRSAHPWHRDVEQETLNLIDDIGPQELLGRRKRARGEAELPQQVRDGLAHRLVIVDDRDQGRSVDQGFLTKPASSIAARSVSIA